MRTGASEGPRARRPDGVNVACWAPGLGGHGASCCPSPLLATREPELRQWGSMCLEEAYEAVECVKDGDLASLRDELGDVLLQVLFHTRIAAERAVGDGGFTIDDVADALAAKLTGKTSSGRSARNAAPLLAAARHPCLTGWRSGSPRFAGGAAATPRGPGGVPWPLDGPENEPGSGDETFPQAPWATSS
jgi:NTP pyrophosphatase (non-canonical NTP hydrolase)